jgi:predicted dienelactone hydrolase
MFALLLILILLACMVAPGMRRSVSPRGNRHLRLAALGVCLLQLLVEGPRVELVPAYVMAGVFSILLLIVAARRLPNTASHSGRTFGVAVFRWTGIGVGTVALLSAMLLYLFTHNLDLPVPAGPYAIGTTDIRLTDEARDELFTEAGDDHRQILVRVSYPAAHGAAFEDLPRDKIPGIAALITGALWPNRITTLWGAIPTHARRDAPPVSREQPFPVLLYSHGMGGYPEMNTALIEHLVSHGYIVMAISHPFLSANFRYEDGMTTGIEVLTRTGPHSDTEEQSLREEALDELMKDPANASTTRLAELVRERAAVNPLNMARWADIHRLMSDDQRFLLDSLAALQAGSLLAGRLDLDRVGVFGMSSGGTVSHMTCVVDSRCRAGLNLDGFQSLLIDLPPLQRPFMHMSSEGNLQLEVAYERSEATSYLVRVRRTRHASFTDGVLTMHRLRDVGLGDQVLGSIDGQYMVDLVNEYVLAFFNANLLGRSEPLLDGPDARYPEVTILKRE